MPVRDGSGDENSQPRAKPLSIRTTKPRKSLQQSLRQRRSRGSSIARFATNQGGISRRRNPSHAAKAAVGGNTSTVTIGQTTAWAVREGIGTMSIFTVKSVGTPPTTMRRCANLRRISRPANLTSRRTEARPNSTSSLRSQNRSSLRHHKQIIIRGSLARSQAMRPRRHPNSSKRGLSRSQSENRKRTYTTVSRLNTPRHRMAIPPRRIPPQHICCHPRSLCTITADLHLLLAKGPRADPSAKAWAPVHKACIISKDTGYSLTPSKCFTMSDLNTSKCRTVSNRSGSRR